MNYRICTLFCKIIGRERALNISVLCELERFPMGPDKVIRIRLLSSNEGFMFSADVTVKILKLWAYVQNTKWCWRNLLYLICIENEMPFKFLIKTKHRQFVRCENFTETILHNNMILWPGSLWSPSKLRPMIQPYKTCAWYYILSSMKHVRLQLCWKEQN